MRVTLLRAAAPLTRLISTINLRIGKPPLTGEMYREMLHIARPGDLILTRTSLRPTNLFIPGKWSHLQILAGDPYGTTIEATMPLVRYSSLVDVWAGASEVMLIRPRFASQQQRIDAYDHAKKYIGLPYDTEFELTDNEFYCSELVVRAYADAGSAIPWHAISRNVGGDTYVVPSDFENETQFEILWHGGDKT